MSKLAMIYAYQNSPMAGGFLSSIVKGAKKLFGIGKKAAATVATTYEKLPKSARTAISVAAPAAAYLGAEALAGSGGGGGGATGGWGSGRRRSRGITARELRGYRKVANLLHKEGMVSRRAHRGRSH